MAIYFTDNQYLKTAEEDFEAAESLFGQGYYDQVVSLLSIAMTKFLKSMLESMYPTDENTEYYMTEDKITLLHRVKEKIEEIPIFDKDCRWMDNLYGKANCTDGIHIIMPKQSAQEAFYLLANVRKEARRLDKESEPHTRYFLARGLFTMGEK